MNLHKNVKLMLFLGRSILFQLFFAFKMAYFLFQLRGYLDFVQTNYKINHLKVANFPKVAQKVDTAVLAEKVMFFKRAKKLPSNWATFC